MSYCLKSILFAFTFLYGGSNLFSQMGTPVDSAMAKEILLHCQKTFPKFYRVYTAIKTEDTLLKNIVFVRYQKGMDQGPAKAGPRGNIVFDIAYLEEPRPQFGDDRLVVVLYHEIGHLHYFHTVPPADRNREENEKFAFEYSLRKTKEIAEDGDCEPLRVGLQFMKLRSESTNLEDPHVPALKRMIKEAVYKEYTDYLSKQCP